MNGSLVSSRLSMNTTRHRLIAAHLVLLSLLLTGCGGDSAATVSVTPTANAGADAEVTRRGTVEVTARLVEIPDGAIIKRDLYDYTAILKYEVVSVHRGTTAAQTIYVGQYNPFKPRSAAADKRVKDIGGTLGEFKAGQLQRLALEQPLDDFYLGGVIDKYFGKHSGPVYWAVWTNAAE